MHQPLYLPNKCHLLMYWLQRGSEAVLMRFQLLTQTPPVCSALRCRCMSCAVVTCWSLGAYWSAELHRPPTVSEQYHQPSRAVFPGTYLQWQIQIFQKLHLVWKLKIYKRRKVVETVSFELIRSLLDFWGNEPKSSCHKHTVDFGISSKSDGPRNAAREVSLQFNLPWGAFPQQSQGTEASWHTAVLRRTPPWALCTSHRLEKVCVGGGIF